MKNHSPQTFILSIGGSLLVPDTVSVDFFKSIRSFLRAETRKGHRFIVVCGGGRTCRAYQEALSSVVRLSHDQLDLVGIHATRLNAHALRLVLGDIAYDEIITNPTRLPKTDAPVIIAGGWKPGFSTDYVAVTLARSAKSSAVINLSNIDYVYDRDPRVHADAEPIRSLSWAEYHATFGSAWRPGLNSPFDPVASRLADSLGITVSVVNGANIPNLRAMISGRSFTGTTLS